MKRAFTFALVAVLALAILGCSWPLGFNGGSAFSTGDNSEKTTMKETRTPAPAPTPSPAMSDNATAAMMREFFQNPPTATTREAVVERKATGQATTTGPTITGGNLKSIDTPGAPTASAPGAQASGSPSHVVNEPVKQTSAVVWALIALGVLAAIGAGLNWYFFEELGTDKWKTTAQLAAVSGICFLGAFLFDRYALVVLALAAVVVAYIVWKNADDIWAKLKPKANATP